MKYFLSNILALVAVLLFCFNYLLAEYFHPWSLTDGSLCDANLAFRFNCYSVIITICFMLTRMKTNHYTWFILDIGVGIVLSDVLDRFVFDVTKFQFNDITMILLTIATSYYKFLLNVRKRSSSFK